MSIPPLSASFAAEMQPEDSEGIKGLAVVTQISTATSSKASAAAVLDSSSAASSKDAAYVSDGYYKWSAMPFDGSTSHDK